MSNEDKAAALIIAAGLTAVAIGLYKLVEWLLNNYINTFPSVFVFVFIIFLLFLALCLNLVEGSTGDNDY